jgi:hypothetical protein
MLPLDSGNTTPVVFHWAIPTCSVADSQSVAKVRIRWLLIAVFDVWAFNSRVHTKKHDRNLSDDFSSNPPQNEETKAATK